MLHVYTALAVPPVECYLSAANLQVSSSMIRLLSQLPRLTTTAEMLMVLSLARSCEAA